MTARYLVIPVSGCIFSSLNITYTLIWSLVFLIFLRNPFPHSAWTRGENVKLSQSESLQPHHPLGLWQSISLNTREVCVMLVLLMTAGLAGRLQKGPPQSISPEFS
jgi:hypothetical protein